MDTSSMCSHLKRKLFDEDGPYHKIWFALQEDEELTAVVRSRQLHIYRNGKKIMILANKLSTALELLGRVQLGYSYLPKWLKSATVNINKGELTFSNMSSIRAFASSSDAARGFSANCIFPDTKITIRLFKCNFLKFSIKIKYLKWLKFLNFI